ncbi:MAG: cytidylate kinase-like family protein [Alphaproteobacteria bacterium]|nr:cytidylate kinase-like family protein [Alphaproteobacteria bacterium]MBF0392771.1 cytidylate kinase-like family protein [Alphaproteobacteria bacterium]
MTTDVLSAIAAMAEVVSKPAEGTLSRPKQPVITISRDCGSGGDIIAERLAQRLGVPYYEQDLLRRVAERLETDVATARMLDEGIGRAKEMWLYRLFSGQDLSPDTYRDALARVIMSLGRAGGVLVGRGAHVVLANACALRVRVSGTPEICARRLAASQGQSEAEALAHVKDVNHHRGEFVWEMFRSRLSEASQFDITINTDRMVDFEDVVEMLESMAKAVHRGSVLGKIAD